MKPLSSRFRGWLVAMAIFMLGVALGSAGTTVVGARLLRQFIQNIGTGPSAAERAADRIGADLTKTLQLTPEQSARVQTLLDESAASMKAVRSRALAEAAAELRVTIAKIAATLPPEKRAGYYTIIRHRFERLGLTAPTPPPPAP